MARSNQSGENQDRMQKLQSYNFVAGVVLTITELAMMVFLWLLKKETNTSGRMSRNKAKVLLLHKKRQEFSLGETHWHVWGYISQSCFPRFRILLKSTRKWSTKFHLQNLVVLHLWLPKERKSNIAILEREIKCSTPLLSKKKLKIES